MEERLRKRIDQEYRRRKYRYLYSPKGKNLNRYDKKYRRKRSKELYKQSRNKGDSSIV